ncbi:S8 family serine peptidase [Austwickia sp. TVS 96-490-7B]|uniref:S8 family serine peptidase n=1 Tax=Austwickia sp. TVS 96-490-7B TaxID=2830843 RepID=UPI001C5A3FC9|nr:S8 family serine peptidase [Austwickia sp. TVS 96-490-7B]
MVAGVVWSMSVSPVWADNIRDRQWWISAMNIDKSLLISRGAGVKICLIDSGVDTKHPDLQGVKFAGGKDMTGGGSPDGLQPHKNLVGDHGTGMAVNIAGRGHGPNGSEGMLGAAPDAEIMSISFGSAPPGPDPVTEGIKYCTDSGAKVISLSLSGATNGIDAAISYAQSKDVAIVAATGNEGDQLFGGWTEQFGVLLVGGVDKNLKRDKKSNFGKPNSNSLMGVYSQGVGVCGPFSASSEPRVEIPQAIPGGGYKMSSGTSVATAVVAGVVAAVRSKHPDLDAANVINRVIKTAQKSGSGDVPNADCGWGVVDADAALTADVPKVDSNPLGQMDDKSKNAKRTISGVKSMGVWDPSYQPDAQSPAKPSGPTAISAEPVSGPPVGLIVGVVGACAALAGGAFWGWRRLRR